MKIKLKYTKLQIMMELVAALIMVGMVAYLIFKWGDVPDKIPGHYNAAGEIDRWGNKSELIVLPIISFLMYLLLTGVERFPSIWNMPVKITDKNRDEIYGNMLSMLIVMKVGILACFSYLSYNGIEAKSLSIWYLPVFLVIIFGTMIYYIVKTVKVSKNNQYRKRD